MYFIYTAFSHILYSLLISYLSISFLSLISIFIINYLKTKDAFKENKYINLSSEKLCDKTIKTLSECIKEKTLIKCQYENKAVEYCYDESYSMNLMCFTYISELNLCLRTLLLITHCLSIFYKIHKKSIIHAIAKILNLYIIKLTLKRPELASY